MGGTRGGSLPHRRILLAVSRRDGDDLLTATILTTTAPVMLAPAMHTQMWLNPATQENVATLRRRGLTVLTPDSGRLTGKDSGVGRLPEPDRIVTEALAVLESLGCRGKVQRAGGSARGGLGGWHP